MPVPDATGVLAELRRWIEASWDPELSLARWRELLADTGWACPAWPRGWCGRSLPAGLAALVTQELAGAGVPGPAEGVGVGLAGLTTRAEAAAGGWQVTGQKVWSTGAATAERTAASEPHKWYPQRAGRPPGPEGSLGKLASSVIARQAARVHAQIAGPHGMLAGTGSPLDGIIAEIFLSVPAISIAGGTDQIQRTIIGERILGLPREPDPSRNLPFREVPGGLSGPRRRPYLLPGLRAAGRCHAAPAHPRLLRILSDVAAEHRGARRRAAGHHVGPAWPR
jgi:alkylation response protein AidB-like acyl-CoA dehydrogenase